MTESPDTTRPLPVTGTPAPQPAAYPAPDEASWTAQPPAAAEPAPPVGRRRRFGRWITAAILVGVLLVGGVGGFAIGRATAPEISGPFGERPDGGQVPGGGSGEMPQPPSDRSGGGTGDQGSASDGATEDSTATGASATT
jgi:hypothetical protein